MKKKILGAGIAIILMIMLVTLTGCGNNNEGNNQNSTKNNNKKLSEVVKIGDYVDYKTQAGNTYTATAEKTGVKKDQIFETTGEEKWRVLSIEDDGTVNLISAEGLATKFEKKFQLYSEAGFTNGVQELDNISKIYANGNHAISARSMRIKDVINLIGVDKIAKLYENQNEIDLSSYSGDEKMEQVYKLMNKEYGNTYTLGGVTKTVNRGFNWASSISGYGIEDACEDKTILSLLTIQSLSDTVKGSTWLADEMVDVGYHGKEPEYFICGLGYCKVNDSTSNSSLSQTELYYINKEFSTSTYPDNFIRPVITIESNTKIESGNGTKEEPFTLK